VITQNPQQLFKLQFDPWGVKLQETINDHGMTILKKKDLVYSWNNNATCKINLHEPPKLGGQKASYAGSKYLLNKLSRLKMYYQRSKANSRA
jgi:hypothetical protein